MFSRNTFYLAFLSTTILIIGWWIFLQLQSDHRMAWNYAFNIAYGVPFALAGGWVLFRCWQWRQQGHSDTVAFTFFGIAQLFYAVAQGLWTYVNFQQGIDAPTSSVVDYFYGGTAVLEVVAFSILLFHRKHKKPLPRPLLILAMLATVAASFFVPFLVFSAENVWSAPFSFDAFYTGTSLVTIFLILVNIYREWHHELRPFLFFSFLAAAVSGFGDLVFAFRVHGGDYWNGDASDGLFAISSLLYFFAICGFLPPFLTHSKHERREVGFFRHEVVLPASLIIFSFLFAARAAEYVYTVPLDILDPHTLYSAALIVFVAIVALATTLAGIVYLVLSQQVQLQDRLAAKTRTLQEKIAELGRSKFYLDRVSDAVIAMDASGRVVYVNHAVNRLFRIRTKEFIGQTRFALLGKTVASAARRAEKMLRERDAWETEASVHTPGVPKRDVLLTFVSLHEDDHHRVGTLMLVRDITERKAVEHAKSQFVSMASHQLRAPMTQLRWLVEQAQGQPRLPARLREQLGDMEKIILLENKFVKDLLDVSRIERGALKLTMEDIAITDLLHDALRALQKDAEDAKAVLRMTGSTNIVRVHIDREKIAEAIRNIVHNAIKFSPPHGTVRVEAGINQENGIATIMVADEGSGIPEELWSGLFDMKITPSTDPRAGAGLGLYLSKSFVEAVGGRLRFETSTNGTVFYITLPLAARQPSKTRPRARSLPNP